ncbi:hypothetical protein ACJRO7_005362 [Eucalyptus globulus]|uniref:Uncharacterized protein n=1 Tax=Eucalyptus globulus TaxID=34317 RepID=A0ABD3J2I0_EUCGL
MSSLSFEEMYCLFCEFFSLRNLKWKAMASANNLCSNLFRERWGEDRAAFYDPANSKVMVRGHTSNTFIIHQGEIQHRLGSRTFFLPEASYRCQGILDKILFFIADIEAASIYAKLRASIASTFIYVYNYCM